MKVLVATAMRQGEVDNDFCNTIEGELVRLPFIECDDGDQCGCTRSFTGLTSHRATTTAVILDEPELDRATYTRLLLDDLIDDIADARLARPPGLDAMVDDEVDDLLDMIGDNPVDVVVRRQGDWVVAFKPLRAG